jgi:hypothetical protein
MRHAPPLLMQEIDAVLAAAGQDSPAGAALVDELVELAASLDGLPAATFVALQRLPGCPDTLARMLFAASEAQLGAVLALSEALPFAWYLLPRSAWQGAQRARLDRALAALHPLGDAALPYALQMVEQARMALIAAEPLLGSVLAPVPVVQKLGEAAQAFLNRSADRIQRTSGNMFRSALPGMMPTYFDRFDPRFHEALDAPCAAAAAVRADWLPGPVHVRRIKSIARTHPTYFAEAFAASLAGVD